MNDGNMNNDVISGCAIIVYTLTIEKKLGKNPPKNRSIMNRWRCVLFISLRAWNEKSLSDISLPVYFF